MVVHRESSQPSNAEKEAERQIDRQKGFADDLANDLSREGILPSAQIARPFVDKYFRSIRRLDLWIDSTSRGVNLSTLGSADHLQRLAIESFII
jgi:hypothetical protein